MRDARHERPGDELRDRVSVYLLGGMTEDESAHFEAHLEHCCVCRGEVDRIRPVVDELMLSLPECEPPPSLRRRVLALFRKERSTLRAASARGWIATDVPGVEFLPLWRDPQSGRHKFLIRMRPGTTLPAHRHRGPEECTVIAGDLCEGELELTAGHSMRKEAGSVHSVFSRGGCLLFMTASRRAERLPEDSEAP